MPSWTPSASEGSRHRRKSRPPSLKDSERWILELLAAAIIGSALAIGGVHAPVLVLVAAVVLVACYRTFRANREAPRFAPVLICVALAGWTYLQTVPLPISVLSLMASDNADVWARSLRPLGEPSPGWGTISLDPGASLVEGLKWLLYAGVIYVAVSLGRSGRAVHVIATVFGSALLTGIVTVAHGLVGARRVFGIYTPETPPLPWHVSPLLNANNLAGYLNLGAYCGLALLLSRRSPLSPWVSAVGVTAIIGASFSSGSRGGFVSLTAGFVVLVAIIGLSREGSSQAARRKARGIIAACVGGGVLLAGLAFQQDVWQELYDKDLGKLKMALWAKPMIARHFLFGVGRGAFETVFPVYRTVPGNVVYSHAENFPVQWIVEWGVPIGALALGAFAWAFRPRNLGVGRSTMSSAAAVGVLVILVQNLVDLGLEVPAVSVAVFATLGALWGDQLRMQAEKRDVVSGSTRLLQPAVLVPIGVAVAAMWLALPAGSHAVSTERNELYEEVTSEKTCPSADCSNLRSRVRQAILRHPAEPYFPFLGAVLAIRGRDQDPLPWLARSLERAPVNGAANFLLAQTLAARGAKKQALMELRFAVTSDEALTATAAQAAAQWSDDLDDLLRAVPDGETGVPMLESLSTSRVLAPTTVRKLLLEAIRRMPDRARARELLAEENLRELRGDSKTGACDGPLREVCERDVELQVAELVRLLPTQSTGARVLSGLLLVRGRPDEAERHLAGRCPLVEDKVECLAARATIAARLPGPEPLTTATRELAGVACGAAAECARISMQIGDLFGGRGEWGRALNHYLHACDAAPNSHCWLRVGQAAAETGAHAQAAQAFSKAYKLGGEKDPALKERMQLERAKALGTTL